VRWRIERVGRVASTSDLVWRRAAEGAPEGLVVLATEQSAGRGRHGRRWVSPAGNLYASWLLRPQVVTAGAASLSLVAGLAVRDALAGTRVAVDRLRLKWPNDILVGDAKLGGVLLEGRGEGGRCGIVVGVGINVAAAPAGTGRETTSLRMLGDDATTVDRLLELLLDSFAKRYERWRTGGFAGQRAEWMSAAYRIGDMTSLRIGEGRLEGRFVDVDADGALWLELAPGWRRRFMAGELVFGPPAPRPTSGG
jgi:birA, biotin-[acetyl-CoA-carboxylase] ligase region